MNNRRTLGKTALFRSFITLCGGAAVFVSALDDSIFVQFDRSIDAAGAAVYRTGTSNAAIVMLEDCINCGVSGWGWPDTGFGAGVMGPDIYFAAAGTQRLRSDPGGWFQHRPSRLSPAAHLRTSPGALKNDTTILGR